jgi:1-acyl-sn-glycerol-3-phosphate acyltransferase
VKRQIYLLIKKIVALVMPVFKVEGAENLPDGPAVIVGNHSQIYGPIAAELYIPGRHYTWCISDMMEKECVADYAYKDFWSKKPLLIRPFFRLFSYLLPHLAELIFTNANTLPVYRDKRVMKTFQLSCDKLSEGARVVIFPEDYTEYNNIVHKFQRGFVHLGKYYYRTTNNSVPFVPMYVCPSLKKLVFGKPIYFDPGAKSGDEAERICTYLQETISETAYKMPRHRVVPYPNISKRYYPYNERLQ